MARKSPFKAWGKKIENFFKPSSSGGSDSDDGGHVQAALRQLNLAPDYQKQVEKALREQLARKRAYEAEKRRQELLEGTSANLPWKPIARPGDEMYPSFRSQSTRETSKSKAPKRDAPKKAATTGQSPKLTKSTSIADTSQSSGLEPPPIDQDEESSKSSVRSSSLMLLLEDLAKDAESTRVEPSKKQKPPQAMSPTELVELRRRDEEAWRRLTRENTVMALAGSMPTDEDTKKAAETTKKGHRAKVKFNDAVETIVAPIGQPYKANEPRTKQTGEIELERTRKS